jgi:endonuclease/exonuclease/phosphatase family metal-dependent hydrolase
LQSKKRKSGFSAAATAGPGIDWIGVSRDWQVLQAGIDRTQQDGRTPSDHYPVTSLLRRARKGDKSN